MDVPDIPGRDHVLVRVSNTAVVLAIFCKFVDIAPPFTNMLLWSDNVAAPANAEYNPTLSVSSIDKSVQGGDEVSHEVDISKWYILLDIVGPC